MSPHISRLLVVDADTGQRDRVVQVLTAQRSYSIETAADVEQAWLLIAQTPEPFALALINDLLPRNPGAAPARVGLELIRQVKAESPETEVIIYTDRSTPDAEDAVRAGAFHYLYKPIDLAALSVLAHRAVEHHQLKLATHEKRVYKTLLDISQTFIDGESRENTFDLLLEGVEAGGFECSSLYLLSDDGASLREAETTGRNGNRPAVELPLSDNPALRNLLTTPRPRLLRRDAGDLAPLDKLLGTEAVSECGCVTLWHKGKSAGLILADNRCSGRPIAEEALRLLSLFAAQASLALENHSLGEAKKRALNLQAALQISRTVNSSLDLDQILLAACRAAVDLLGVDHSGLVLFDDRLETGEVRAEYPDKGALGKVVQVLGVEPEERLVRSQKFLAVPDVEGERSFGPVRELLMSLGIRSILIVPVVSKGRVLGSFSLDMLTRRREFGPDEIELCTVFASQLAVAIENGRLYEETRKQKDHLNRLIASSPNGMVAVDMQGRIIEINQRAKEILGCGEELLNSHVSGLYLDPQEPGRIRALLNSSLDKRIIAHKTFLKKKSGEAIPVRVSATWLYDSDKNVLGSIGYFEDLSTLQDVERRLELLLSASNVISETENLEEGLGKLARMIVSLLGKTFCQILLLDESELFLVVRAAALLGDEESSVRWEPGLGQRIGKSEWPPELDSVLSAGEPKLIGLQDDDARQHLLAYSRRLLLEKDIQSVLLVPLKIGSRPIGLLCVCEIFEERSAFDARAIARAAAVAAQTATLIEYRRQIQISERRKQLLAALDLASAKLWNKRDLGKLQHEIVLLVSELFDCDVAALYLNRPELKELELCVAYGLPDDKPVGGLLPHGKGIVGQVVQTGKPSIVHEYCNWPEREAAFESLELQTVAAAPLKRAGALEFILLIGDRTDQRQLTQNDLEILDRFAARAAVALQFSRLLTTEQRVFDRFTILQKISDFLQKEQSNASLDQIFHIVLTGITAGYGLGFNRAVLLLRDEDNGDLVGRLGIGHVDEDAARASWETDHRTGAFDFMEYLRRLRAGELPTTPVGEVTPDMRFAVDDKSHDLFSRAVCEQRLFVSQTDRHRWLPKGFVKLLKPTMPVVVAPLVAREHVLGLIVVDNEFTKDEINSNDEESLMAFCSAVAIAFDNIRLLQETEIARSKLSSLYRASNELVSRADHRRVLDDIVSRTRVAAGAAWVSIILIDEMGRAQLLSTAGRSQEISIDEVVREGGYAQQVIRTRQPAIISNKGQHTADEVNPLLLRDKAVASLYLPLTLEGEPIGVMWINYDEPRRFPTYEIDALQLYANQAAIAYDSARRMEELDHMRKTANALAGAVDLQEVLELIVAGARDVLRADSAAIWSYDAVRNIFIMKNSVVDGISRASWEQFWKREPRPGGTAFSVMDRKYIAVENVHDAVQYPFLGNNTRSLLGQVGVESFQGVALTVGTEILGVLYVNYNRTRHFTTEERESARTFATQAALTLKKAKLHGQVTKARDTAHLVAEVTALEDDLNKTLQLIVKGTCHTLGCDATTLYTYDQDHERFGFPPAMEGVDHVGEVLGLGKVADHSVVHNILAQPDLLDAYDASHEPLLKGRFINREGIKSCVATPLIVKDRKVGVMFVNYRTPHRFTDDELINIKLFARQAAVAIRNAQLFHQEQKRVSALRSLYKAGKAISRSLNEREILQDIADETCQLASSQDKTFSYVNILLVEGTHAVPVAAYPAGELEHIYEVFGREFDLEVPKEGDKLGLLGMAVLKEKTQRCNDVSKEPEYINFHEETHSQLVVLIKIDNQIMGAISVEHPEPDAFDEADERALEALAAQAAVAMQNARRYQALNKFKEFFGDKTALEWIKLVSAAWGHNIRRDSSAASGLVEILQKRLKDEAGYDKVKGDLTRLAEVIDRIKGMPITPPLSRDSGRVPVNDLLGTYLPLQWKHDIYRSVRLDLNLQPDLDSLVTVRASREWLRELFQVIVENAARAMSEMPREGREKRLSVKTSLEQELGQEMVEITFTDTGPGIPPNILPKLSKDVIKEEEGGRGAGIGMMLAHTIVQTYEGVLNISSSDKGAVVQIRLPVERNL